MKKDQETYGESLRNLHTAIQEFRDAVLEAAPFKWIMQFFRWLEDHDAWLWLIIGLALLPFFLALAVVL
jgi:hypothetical protein